MSSVAKKQPDPGRKRYGELDVLRGLAAIAVVLCHYTSECNTLGRMDHTFHLGSYGPHLFFMISGFVIFMTLQRCERSSDFVASRIIRLYPVYWFAVTISALLLLLVPQDSTPRPTVGQFVGNLTMLQTWLRIPDIEEAYWTLGVELKFYFIAFLALSLQQLKRSELLVVGWLATVVIYRFIDSVIGLPHALGTPLIVPSAHLFAAGIMFFLIHRDGHSILRHGIISLAIPLQYWAAGTESMIVVSLFIGTFYIFVLGQLRWIVNKPLLMLGRISYPLYLVHGSIGVATIHSLADRNVPLWLLVAAPISISLAVATLIHVRLEQPSGRVLRNWWTTQARHMKVTATATR